MMDEAAVRLQFETWLRAQPHVLNIGRHLPDGKYVLPEDETAWQAWLASRGCVVITLPPTPNRGIGYGLFDAGKEACREAIEAAGLRVAQ